MRADFSGEDHRLRRIEAAVRTYLPQGRRFQRAMDVEEVVGRDHCSVFGMSDEPVEQAFGPRAPGGIEMHHAVRTPGFADLDMCDIHDRAASAVLIEYDRLLKGVLDPGRVHEERGPCEEGVEAVSFLRGKTAGLGVKHSLLIITADKSLAKRRIRRLKLGHLFTGAPFVHIPEFVAHTRALNTGTCPFLRPCRDPRGDDFQQAADTVVQILITVTLGDAGALFLGEADVFLIRPPFNKSEGFLHRCSRAKACVKSKFLRKFRTDGHTADADLHLIAQPCGVRKIVEAGQQFRHTVADRAGQ